MFDGNGVPPRSIGIRVGTAEDAGVVADLHVAAINEGFLATLGSRFLRRLYARIAVSPHGFLIVAIDDDDARSGDRGARVIGFVAGATSVGSLYREFLLRDGLLAAATSVPQLARSIPRAVETLRYGAKGDSAGESSGRESELLSLAVDPAARRRGAGAALVRAFSAAAVGAGSTTARVVVGAGNDSAIRLYLDAGFLDVKRFEMHEGTESLLLRATFSDVAPR